MLAELNNQQRCAVESEADKLLVLAGAGTGKTFTMLERISKLVSKGVSPSSILVLTFTNAAAFEMKERYKYSHKGKAIPEFRTFHSFCYSLIINDIEVRKKLGYFKVPKVADDSDVKRIKTKARMMCGTKLNENKLTGNTPVSQSEKFEKDVYWKQYNKLMKDEGLITFDTLCYGVCYLFSSNSECVTKYKDMYKYIFVDEFQDTDKKQYEFVSSFESAHLFVVGDALQSIYSFRGASPDIIKSLSNDSVWTSIKLFENYRSTQQICDFANNMSKYADESYRIEIHSDRQGADVVVEYKEDPDYDEPVGQMCLSDIIKRLKTLEGTSAILCRTNAEVDYVVNVLTSKGLTCRTGKRNVDAINILKSVTDSEYMVSWLATFLNAAKYAEYIRLTSIKKDEESELDTLLNNFSNIFAIKTRLSKIVEIRNIIKSDKLRFQKCADILKTLELPMDVQVDTEVDKASDFLNNLIEAISEDFESDLYVGTIHSSKGLEYNNVFLLNVDTRLFKLDNEDNLNLYYVGITRAKNNLYIYYQEDEDDFSYVSRYQVE